MNIALCLQPRLHARKEIAATIFLGFSTTTAVSRLNRWIKSDPVLLEELLKAGYQKGSHWFTPKIVRVLERFFL